MADADVVFTQFIEAMVVEHMDDIGAMVDGAKGKAITSLMDDAFRASMANRSNPSAQPQQLGSPSSIAARSRLSLGNSRFP